MLTGENILAADIGGTWARLARVLPGNDGRPCIAEGAFRKYRSADYSHLEDIIGRFLDETPGEPLAGASLASAGYFSGDVLQSSNLPWEVSRTDLKTALGTDNLVTMNDFVAVAYGSLYLDQGSIINLNQHAVGLPNEARAVLGAGTGLGAAVVISDGMTTPAVFGSEAGFATFAPRTARERDIASILEAKLGDVVIEHLLSGPGIANLYFAMSEIMGQACEKTDPGAITVAARDGSDEVAVAALTAFCEIFGDVAGDLAMTYGARGGIWLAGGVIPHFREFFLESNFMHRFLERGPMKNYLENIPVNLIDHGELGVLGAAGWLFDRAGLDRGPRS